MVSRGVERFEDLVAGQKARALAAAIYQVTASGSFASGSFARDYGLRDQMRRAAVSVMSNIAEGFERARPAEFHQFLSMAKASCAELRSQLYIASDVGYLDPGTFDTLLLQTEEIARLVGGLRASVERRRNEA